MNVTYLKLRAIYARLLIKKQRDDIGARFYQLMRWSKKDKKAH